MNTLNYLTKVFNNKIKGKTLLSKTLTKYDGQQGHNLETVLEIKHNCDNKPDLDGYEIKTGAIKTTLGDYKASEYIFDKKKPIIDKFNKWTNNEYITRQEFLQIFGTIKKNNRYTWSGECVGKYNVYNEFGQTLEINVKNDICIYYVYNKDNRDDEIKEKFPEFLKQGRKKILIAIWTKEKMEIHIDGKFNVKGTVKFVKDKDKKFIHMVVYKPFNYTYFLNHLKQGNVIFDSGMSNSSSRQRSNFRCYNKFWDELFISKI